MVVLLVRVKKKKTKTKKTSQTSRTYIANELGILDIKMRISEFPPIENSFPLSSLRCFSSGCYTKLGS